MQHGETSIGNLPSLRRCATIAWRQKQVYVTCDDEKHENAESNQKIFPDAFHSDGPVA